MATEYKLSYTASEIDRMLGEVDKPKSWNDLTDKPFGVQTEVVTLLEEQSITGTFDEEFGYYMYIGASDFSFEPNKTYRLIRNGITYDLVATQLDEQVCEIMIDDMNGFATIVNGTSCEFNCIWDPELGETITLTIYEEEEKEVIKKIDPKFLPDDGVVYYYYNSSGDTTETGIPCYYLYADADFTVKVSREEIRDSFNKIIFVIEPYSLNRYTAIAVYSPDHLDPTYLDYAFVNIITEDSEILRLVTAEFVNQK